ncbi:MAG: hypothetical protein JNK78_06850 [Planctomycetes bacterium]|nr:hypothetical protein [Planctomycetota bacterium]
MTARSAFTRAAAILLADAAPMGTKESRPRLAEALRIVWPHLAEAARRFGETAEMKELRKTVQDTTTLEIVVGTLTAGRVARISAHLAIVARRLRELRERAP